jgi:hypothetical protein
MTGMATIEPVHFRFTPTRSRRETKPAQNADLDSALAMLADRGASGAALASMAEAAGLRVDGDQVEVLAQVDAANVAATQQAVAAAGGRADKWPGRHAQRRPDQAGSGSLRQC